MLDVSVWLDRKDGYPRVMHSFYEKPTCGTRVLQSDTALGRNTIMSSMRQETVRRLVNTSEKVSDGLRQDILKRFAQKLINSQFSKKDTTAILIEGCTKYEHLKWKDKLPRTHEKYAPLHLSADFNKHQRKKQIPGRNELVSSREHI